MAEVTLQNVSKSYPGAPAAAPAVRDLSLRIPDGALAVLVGPSGCGKSTTLRMIAGLERPTRGDISIGGRIVNDVHPKDRDVAMVFQSHALYPHLSAYRNMALALRMRRVNRAEIDRRVRAAAAMLEITDLLDRKPAHLSGGQRQRVALGRAIVREPAAFLFDEPLSNLDARLRLSTRAELKALHARLGVTTLHVTHDQEEAMSLGDIIAVMAAGELQQVGPPLDVYRAPANRFVASFLGTPPMNLIEGRLERESGGAAVFVEAGEVPANTVPLPPAAAGRAAAYAGRPITLGVRPQSLRPGPPGPSRGIDAAIDIVEPLGDQIDLACTTPAGHRITARVPADTPARPGERTTLHIADPDRIHLFEPGDFGKNILTT